MGDDMEEIRRLLQQNPPPAPHKSIENQAIEKAMAAFDQKNAKSTQGISLLHRLTVTARTVLQPKDGAFMKRSYMVAGGLCAATLAIALLSTTSLNREFPGWDKKKEMVIAPAKPDAGLSVATSPTPTE